jgi:hypothetical protein
MIIPDKKKAATIIISQMHGYPDHASEEKAEQPADDDECEALGQELLDALAAKNAMAAYDAVKAIFLKVDSEPHEEYEEEEEGEEGY